MTEDIKNALSELFEDAQCGAGTEGGFYYKTFEDWCNKNEDLVKLFSIADVSQQRELFSLADMKQAFETGEKHKYECYADSKERKCYCRNDDDCTWRKYQTFEDWIKAKENCG